MSYIGKVYSNMWFRKINLNKMKTEAAGTLFETCMNSMWILSHMVND